MQVIKYAKTYIQPENFINANGDFKSYTTFNNKLYFYFNITVEEVEEMLKRKTELMNKWEEFSKDDKKRELYPTMILTMEECAFCAMCNKHRISRKATYHKL